MNIDIRQSDAKTVQVGPNPQENTGSLFTIQKPAVPLAGGTTSTQKPSPPPPQQQQLSQPPQTQPRQTTPVETKVSDAQDMLSDFANPVKAGTQPSGFGSYGSDSMTDGSDSMTDGSDKSVSEFVVDEEPDEDKPSPGFTSIDDEKSHILWKLSRAKRSGMPVHRNLTIDSNIRELRNELKRVEYELSLNQSLRFQKRMLCLAVSGMEVLTERYSLFDLQLKGWSSSVQDDIDSFDSVLTRLHDKYKDRASMPPELQLLLMLVSSAISFHVTKSMMKSLSQPGGGGLGGLLQSMMGGQQQKQSTTIQEMAPPPPQQQPPQPQQQPQPRPPQTFQRQPMKGPSGMPGGMLQMTPDPMVPPQISRGDSQNQRQKRPRSDEEEERISDVVSDDSESTDSASETSSSGDEEPLKIQTVPTANTRGRGRGGRGRGRGPTKTIVTL